MCLDNKVREEEDEDKGDRKQHLCNILSMAQLYQSIWTTYKRSKSIYCGFYCFLRIGSGNKSCNLHFAGANLELSMEREREIRLMTLPPLLIIPQKAQTKTLQMEKPIVCMCSLLKEKKREEERRKRRRQQAAEKRQSILRALAATCHLSLCLRLLLAN